MAESNDQINDQTVKSAIETRLQAHFSPRYLHVEDVSWQHEGHAGARPGGQSHFEVVIAADGLDPLSRVAAHRAINHTLATLLAGPVHALQITIQKD